MNYPIKARELKTNDAKLGGKYRMSNVRELIALAYSLYVSSGKKPSVDYSDGTEKSNRLALAPSLSNEISKMLSINNLNDIISNNPLLTGQFEYILVAMERIFCLGTVVFNNRTYNNSKECYPVADSDAGSSKTGTCKTSAADCKTFFEASDDSENCSKTDKFPV